MTLTTRPPAPSRDEGRPGLGARIVGSVRGWRRSPRRPSRRVAVVSVVVAVVVAVALGVTGWFTPVLRVRDVVVVGNQQVSSHQLLAVADIPTDVPLPRLDLASIEQRIETLDAVADATVTRQWPHTVRVVVTERRPFAVVRTPGGFGVLGSDGTVFRAADGPEADLPFLDQMAGAERSDPGAAAAMSVALGLPPALARRVATLSASAPDRVVLTLRSGATVDWGTADLTARKSAVLLLLLRRGASRYDVSAPDTPVTVG